MALVQPLPHLRCCYAVVYEVVMKSDVGMALVMFRRSNAYIVEHACRSHYFWSCTENTPSSEQVCGYGYEN